MELILITSYIIPVILISRGGASLGLKNTGQSSPLDIVVVNRYQGLPLIFTPVNPKKDVIRVSTDLNIKFSSHGTISDRFTGWETINNWFKIEKYANAYKLVYCPSVWCNLSSICVWMLVCLWMKREISVWL
jgi:hypothetical protein